MGRERETSKATENSAQMTAEVAKNTPGRSSSMASNNTTTTTVVVLRAELGIYVPT